MALKHSGVVHVSDYVYSERFPPRNRKQTGLSIIQVEIEDKLGVLKLDLNRAAVIGYTKQLPVAQPGWPSVLSGEPGFLYRNVELEVALTRDELVRLLRHDLRPQEVLKLLELYGAFHEIHDDFYDESSGVALQPMEGVGS